MDKLLPKLQKALQRITLSLFLIVISHQSLFASIEDSVEAKLKQLSYEEKFFLRNLFCSFLKYDSLGHVLFYQTKPACLASIDKKCHRKSYRQKLLLEGWKCWKHYEHLFQHPNFIFLEEEFSIADESVLHIFIVNKKTLTTSLHCNLELFKKILGPDFSPEKFIFSMEKERVLRPLINHDEALLGLILGYGAESSVAYKRRHNELHNIDDWVPTWSENYAGIEATSPQKCKIHPIGFMGDPKSKEVIHLLNIYTQELEEIWKIYRSSKDSLKLVLMSLCTD